MKKLLCILIALAMTLSLSASAFAVESSTVSFEEVSAAFGIPVAVLKTLDADTFNSLATDAVNNKLISSKDTYVKVTLDENRNPVMQESTFAEYFQDTHTRISNPDSSSGWMKFNTSIFEKDSTTGQASCAFTWLTPPAPRMTDVVGLALTQGTFDYGTSNGFYSHSSPNDNYTYNFTASDLHEEGHGVTASFKLHLTDYANGINDFAFLCADFAKEGTSEGVNGSYGHQSIGISINPTFSITRGGKISLAGGLNIATYYAQETGYVSIRWQ